MNKIDRVNELERNLKEGIENIKSLQEQLQKIKNNPEAVEELTKTFNEGGDLTVFEYFQKTLASFKEHFEQLDNPYHYQAEISKDESGFIINFPEFGVCTSADTIEGIQKMGTECLELIISEYIENGDELPTPTEKENENKYVYDFYISRKRIEYLNSNEGREEQLDLYIKNNAGEIENINSSVLNEYKRRIKYRDEEGIFKFISKYKMILERALFPIDCQETRIQSKKNGVIFMLTPLEIAKGFYKLRIESDDENFKFVDKFCIIDALQDDDDYYYPVVYNGKLVVEKSTTKPNVEDIGKL